MRGLSLVVVLIGIGLWAWLTPGTYSHAPTIPAAQAGYQGNFGVTHPELYRDAHPSTGCTQVRPNSDGIVEASAGDIMVLVAQTKGQHAGIVSIFIEPSSERIWATGPIYLCDTLQHANDHSRYAAAQVQ